MAINILPTNYNTFGNAGDFETDRSTWGFADQATYWTASRLYGTTYIISPGSYQARINVTGTKTAVKTNLLPANFNAVTGKKYYIDIFAVIPTGQSPYGLVGSLRLVYDDPGWTFVSQTTFQLSAAVHNIVNVRLQIHRTGASLNNAKVYIGIDDVTAANGAAGEIIVDKFRVREYEDVIVPCTLAINIAGTVITNETVPAASDGSIALAITGGTSPFEYSKDNVNWQASNQFTGLAPGVYTMRVRDNSSPQCTASQAFSVNAAAIAFDFTVNVTNETVSGESNGVIAVTVTGTGGPFTYSKNGGTTYQGSNIFNGLAPGSYIITVKDAGNNTRSLLVEVGTGIVVFDQVHWSKNDIPLTRYASANVSEDNYKMMIDVRAELVPESGNYQSVMKCALPFDQSVLNAPVIFNLRPAFRGIFAPVPPDMNEAAILKLTDRVRLYKVFYGDIFDQMDEPATYTGLPVSQVVLGGLSKFKAPTMSWFNDYVQNNHSFMTWAPLTKEVDFNQEDYLQFWVYDADITTVNLRIKAYFDDNTNQTTTITSANCVYGDVLLIPAGPLNSQAIAINPAKNLKYYELWLTDQASGIVSELRTFVINDYTNPRTRYYLFMNSLGAFEVLRTIGQSEVEATAERDISEKVLQIGYASLDGQYAAGEAMMQKKHKISSGFIAGADSQDWLEYMQEVLLSGHIYDITSGVRVPVVNMTKSMTVYQNEDNRRFVRFEFMSAYSDHSYTPADV